jgi:phage shock protein A
MSDIEQAIRDLISEEVSSVIEDQVEDALSNHSEISEIQYRVEDLEQKVDDANDNDTTDMVVDFIIKKLVGDGKRVVSNSYVQSLEEQVNGLKKLLDEKKPTE